jgi:hypothetical protein
MWITLARSAGSSEAAEIDAWALNAGGGGALIRTVGGSGTALDRAKPA